ncbi:MAG: uncharacterized protein KVP18_003891 [Porospora cf. gigantea A]|nr:MAG: hypothetical protein KVP18_003891 [Porospora cf. gigantea A]
MHEKLTAAVVLRSLTVSYLTPQGGKPVLAMQEARPSGSTDDLLFTSRVSSSKSNDVKDDISNFIPGCWSWLELTFITSSELSRLSSELSLKLPIFLTLRSTLQSVEVQSHPEPLDAIRQCLQSYVTTFGAVAMVFRTSACTVPDVWPPRNPLEVKLADPKPQSSGALVTVFPGLAALTRFVLDGADVFSGSSTNLWSTYHSRYRQTFYRHLHQIYCRKRHGYPGILMTEEFWACRLNPTQIPSPTLAAAKVPASPNYAWTMPAKKNRNLDEVVSRCNALSQRLANLIQRSQVRVNIKLPRVNVVLLNPLAAFEQSSPQMELRVSEEIVEVNLGRWKQTDQLYIRVGNCRVATKGGTAQAVLSLSMIKGLLEQRRREWASVLLLLRSSCLEAVPCDISQDPYFLSQRAHYLSSVPVEDSADCDTCETTLRPPSTPAMQKRSSRRASRRVGPASK